MTRYDNRDNSIHLNTIPIPSPKPNELLVKIASASLCHSDVMHFESNDAGLVLDQNPVTMGHEATGWVAEVGGDVKGFKEGDAVGFLPAYECCYECEQCRKT
jgi:propanol-preferring alcohol dehydrogenase